MKAVHCRRLTGSSAKVDVSASGFSVGIAVLLRANVATIALASRVLAGFAVVTHGAADPRRDLVVPRGAQARRPGDPAGIGRGAARF